MALEYVAPSLAITTWDTDTNGGTDRNGSLLGDATALRRTSPDDLLFGTTARDATDSISSGCSTKKSRRVARRTVAPPEAVRWCRFLRLCPRFNRYGPSGSHDLERHAELLRDLRVLRAPALSSSESLPAPSRLGRPPYQTAPRELPAEYVN